eukprot:5177983-Amphidinium_carterae.1
MAIAPLVFATVYDEVENERGQEMLVCTSCVSFFAVVAYLPVAFRMPKSSKEGHLEMKELSFYEDLSDADFRELPLE